MARYRVGNAYLSEEEYRGYNMYWFTVRLVAVATALGGVGAYRLGYRFALPQVPLFVLTCVGGLGLGFAAYTARRATNLLLWALLVAALLAAGLYAVWVLVQRG